MAFCQSEYNSFLHKLSAWLPLQSTDLVKAQTHIFGESVKRIDWGEIAIIGGITIASIGISVFFPPAAPHVLAVANVMLEGGLEVYQQLKNGDDINWTAVLIKSGAGAIIGAIATSGLGTVYSGLAIGGTGALENLLYSAATGDINKDTISDSLIGGGLEGLTSGAQEWLGGKLFPESVGGGSARKFKNKFAQAEIDDLLSKISDSIEDKLMNKNDWDSK
ncbi:hypothetical protein EIN_110410 [Entamoeba invadens IP1]|uniref:Uncharacterized protein n=1 Tax=Entamoeba invadens IP1 TaxID=370355 RepID=A0A0A1TXW4_ENTIV|nr:hypothetical protein EIN_110410 [Entamoeba invadens IP1]ELP86217.1 hypothetical protein EIN_110410 [Entamoeba invadens IP1]|eukprot:XP_004185563.1 hypothetical protein EIN_110410 [Entamoeba invadens IP1]